MTRRVVRRRRVVHYKRGYTFTREDLRGVCGTMGRTTTNRWLYTTCPDCLAKRRVVRRKRGTAKP